MNGNHFGSGRGRGFGAHGGEGSRSGHNGDARFGGNRDFRRDAGSEGGYDREGAGGSSYGHHGQDGASYYDGRRTLYRARDSKVMGVCKGLARYFDVRVRYVRLAFILAAIFTAFWPVAAVYVLLGLVLKPEPIIIPADNAEKDFYSAYVGSRAEAVRRLRDKFEQVEKRIRRMEDVVTSREYDWERRFNDQAR